MAGDLRRASAVIAACVDHVLRTAPSTDPDRARATITGDVCDQLETRTVGQQRDVVTATSVTSAQQLLTGTLAGLTADLAARTGLPATALTSEPGWRAALKSAGHTPPRRVTRDTLDTLPGTPVVLLLCDTVTVTTALDEVTRGSWHDALDAEWARTTRDGGFDATVDALQPTQPDASRLGWALITFETHKHTNLIWHQANKLERSLPDRVASDLLGWGWLGLRTALRHYDPELGFTFSTYACTRIVGAIRDGVRSENPVPKRLNTFSRKVAASEAELTQALGRVPTMEEVSATIGVELSSLAVLRRTAPQASIEEIVTVLGERGVAPDWMVAHEDPAEAALSELRSDAVAQALASLPADDATAVKLLVMDGLNPTEARAITGATARQLRQRKERGLTALREALEPWQTPDDE